MGINHIDTQWTDLATIQVDEAGALYSEVKRLYKNLKFKLKKKSFELIFKVNIL